MGAALGIDVSEYQKGLTANASNIALELAAVGGGCVATQWSLARTYVGRGLLVEPFSVRAPSPWTYYLSDSQLAKGNVVRTAKDWILKRARAEFPPTLS
jgi:DNA-binding transcriptional LysR family regulator